MSHRRTRWFVLVVIAAALAGCGNDDKTAERTTQPVEGAVVGSWAGKVEGTDAFIAVVARDDGETLAYLCDGKKIAKLGRGPQAAGSFDVSANDTQIKGDLTRQSATGTVTLAGDEHSFAADRTTGDAGLYWADAKLGGRDAVAAWVVLAEGEQRGNIAVEGRTAPAPALNPATGAASNLKANKSAAFKIPWQGSMSLK